MVLFSFTFTVSGTVEDFFGVDSLELEASILKNRVL